MSNELTDRQYWEDYYRAGAGSVELPNLDDFRELPTRRIVDKLRSVCSAGSVIEIGAGNSSFLLHLSRSSKSDMTFWGLDYSESGCSALKDRARVNSVEVEVINSDMLSPPPGLKGKFQFLYSVGVVEHFEDPALVLASLGELLAPGGKIVTIIPNMRGIIGFLSRWWDPKVYALHNPHDLFALRKAHVDAGYDVEEQGYICSTNFGVLSSCVGLHAPFLIRKSYIFLTRLSKVLWFFECRLGDLFKSRLISPYLFIVARKH
jgi:SAM-dependent methyltransferase